MTKNIKTDDNAKLNLENMDKVAGGLNSLWDDPGERKCPRCATVCKYSYKSSSYADYIANYVCPNCGCKFYTWNTNPNEYKITYLP